MLLIRKLLFYLFAILYLILCPLTVLYALGYLFSPRAEKGLIKTGLISLSTVPPKASVYLGNRRYTKKTPTILQELRPGDYPIKLVLKDHEPWSQTVPVEAEKATVLERILLLPKVWRPRELWPESADDMIPLVQSESILLMKGPQLGDVWVYSWKEEKVWPLLPDDSPFQTGRILSYLVAQESPGVLFHVRVREGEKFLWVEPRSEEARIEDLSPFLQKEPERIEYDPRETDRLFVFQDGHLDRVDVGSRTSHLNLLDRIRGYGLFDKRLYVLTEDKTLQRMGYDGNDVETLLNDPALGKTLFGGRGLFQIKVLSEDVILFWREKGELLTNRLPYRLVERGVRGLELDERRPQVLFWQRNRVGLLDFAREPKEGHLFEKGPILRWLFEDGDEIEQAFWVYEGSHILFRDRDRVFLLAIETYGKPHLNELFRVKADSAIWYSESSGTLYYLEPSKGRLCCVEILPKKELIPQP